MHTGQVDILGGFEARPAKFPRREFREFDAFRFLANLRFVFSLQR